MADLFDALGSPEKAEEIRAAGCGWWWSIQYENAATGQTEVRHLCGSAALPDLLRRYGSDVTRAANSVQDDRDEQRRALAVLDDAVATGGLPEILAPLARLGARTYLAEQVRRLQKGDGTDA